MKPKEENIRFTVDIPIKLHKELKMLSATTGKSMKEIFIETFKNIDTACLNSSHVPNDETKKAIKDAEKGIGLITGKEADAISKKFGI